MNVAKTHKDSAGPDVCYYNALCRLMISRFCTITQTLHIKTVFSYVFSVLQALQDGQVVVPGVFGADPAHVLPTGRLLCELPAAAATNRRGPLQRHCFPVSHWIFTSFAIIWGIFTISVNWFGSTSRTNRAGDEYQQQQQPLHTSTRRHLRWAKLRNLLRRRRCSWILISTRWRRFVGFLIVPVWFINIHKLNPAHCSRIRQFSVEVVRNYGIRTAHRSGLTLAT